MSRTETYRTTPEHPFKYAELDARQRELARLVREEGAPGKLLLAEVSSVITVGRRAPKTDLLLSSGELSKIGTEVASTDRGGFNTWHGPGQWIAYPVEKLSVLVGDSRGVRKIVEALLECVLEVARAYDSSAEIRTGCELGVWNGRGKLGALGIHVERGVLLHGVSVNGFKTTQSFAGLRPCGLDAPVAYLLEGSMTKAEQEGQFTSLGKRIETAFLARFWS